MKKEIRTINVCLFLLLITSISLAQPTDYQSLWRAYEQTDHSYYHDAQKMLDEISEIAFEESDELQLFRVNYERYMLRLQYSNWTTKNHLLYLEGFRKTSPQPYEGLYNYLIAGKIISEPHYSNSTPSGKTDLSQYDEWTTVEKNEAAQRYNAAAISQLLEYGNIPAAPFSFLLYASADSLPWQPVLFDLVLMDILACHSPFLVDSLLDTLLPKAIQRHIADNRPQAAVFYELQLLDRRHDIDARVGKTLDSSAYWQELERLEREYPDDISVRYQKAGFLFRHHQTSPEFYALCKEILEVLAALPYDKTQIPQNARCLLDRLTRPGVQLADQKTNRLPRRKIDIPIRYKNIDTLYLTVYRTDSIVTVYQNEKEGVVPPFSTSFQDHFRECVQKQQYRMNPTHGCVSSSDLWIDSLPYGRYTVSLHTGAVPDSDNCLCVFPMIISAVQWTQIDRSDGFCLFASDAQTGKPIAHRKVTLNFDESVSSAVRKSGTVQCRTDKDGRIFIPDARTKGLIRGYDDDVLVDIDLSFPDHNDSYRAEIAVPGDRWRPYRYRYWRARRFNDDTRRNEVQIITDRSLYRPGQTVYFKVILQNNKKPLRHGTVEVTLEKSGKEKLETMTLTLSKFGSASGQFVLPDQPGRYTIRCEKENSWKYYGYEMVEVEEYKLPSFKVELLENPDGEWHHDSIFVKGSAVSYAGFPLIGADVKLRIYSDVFSANRQGEEEFLKTDASGGFAFVFPNHNYSYAATVEAVVTDVNGETHTAKKTIPLGKPLLLSVEMPETVNQWLTDTLTGIVTTRDILKKTVPAPVKVTALRLRMPGKAGVYHPLPQEPLYTEAEYRQYFPEYYFDRRDGDNPAYWDVLDTVWQTVRSFYPDSLLTIDISNWTPGYYKFEYQLVDSIITAKESNIIRIIHSGKQAVPSNKPLQIEILPTEAKIPMEKVRLNLVDNGENEGNHCFRKYKVPVVIGTSLENACVTLCYRTSHHQLKTKRFRLNNESDTLFLRLRNTGYLRLGAFSYKNGQLFSTSNSYSVRQKLTKGEQHFLSKISNKLSVNIIHWNSRFEPGQQGNWEVEITDADNRHPNTEVLAWMFDKSLYGLDMPPMEIQQRRIIRMEELTWGQRQWLELYNRKKFRGMSSRLDLQNSSEKIQPTLKPVIDCSIKEGPALRMRAVRSTFTPDYTTSTSRLSGERVRTTPGRSVTSALSNLEGVSAAEITPSVPSVRGNRSDGTKTVVDGIRVRNGEEKVGAEELTDNPAVVTSPRTYIRKNFTETAFFEPMLRTDREGRVRMVFTVPDQFTEWQMNLYGHTRKGLTVFNSLSATTCQSLMIQSNAPRFFREGDTMMFQAKITNVTDTLLRGNARIEFFNPETNDLIPILLGDTPEKEFQCSAENSTNVSWRVAVPRNLAVIAYRITAQSGRYTDGMEAVLPVLGNRTAVTESMHFVVPAGKDTTLIFSRLRDNQSKTLHSNNYMVEITANPSWTAIQSLQYLMTYRYECNEQLFSKLYANALARHIVTKFPQIEEVYAQWANDTTMQSLESQLFKNEQLKNILLSESPWVMDAQRESARMQQMAKLFQTNRLNKEMETIARKLKNNQMEDGGFAWFGKSFFSPYITSHLVAGYAKLQSLGVEIPDMGKVMRKAVECLDAHQQEKFSEYQKDTSKHKRFYFREEDIQYLYARTWFGADSTWLSQAYVQNLLSFLTADVRSNPLMRQAQTGLVLYRLGRTHEAQRIMERIRQQAITSDEEGMYWKKEYTGNYYRWYQAPIERQSVLIEAFNIISPNKQELDMMKQWLLMQKHQQAWSNTKATAEAVFALMMGDADVLNTENSTTLRVGNERFVPTQEETSVPGTGYFTKSWTEDAITPKLAELSISADTSHFVFGACYWQYVEDIAKVTESSTGLRIQRALYHEESGPNGSRLVPVTAENPVRLGEKLTVRLTITSDRDLEYVHLKDSRAAAFEPVNSHTKYVYRGPLPYTMVPRDAAMDFFFDRVPEGTHIIDYPLLATQLGTFLNGLATAECMYAPEFRGHSAPMIVKVVR